MRKLMLKMSISMDGFCADSHPNGPQKWLFSTADDESNAWELSFIKNAGYHAMGHMTYQVMAGFWPVSTDGFAELMNSIPKLIFTRKGLDAGSIPLHRCHQSCDTEAHEPDEGSPSNTNRPTRGDARGDGQDNDAQWRKSHRPCRARLGRRGRLRC